MINNILQISFHIPEIISQSWKSNISKREKLIEAVALAILALFSLYWIYKAVCLRDRSIKPLNENDEQIENESKEIQDVQIDSLSPQEAAQEVKVRSEAQIVEKVESIELLEKFPHRFSPKQRFQLALQCGEELTKLDLSRFKSLDNEKLKTLQQACPNLRSLNLSVTPIEQLDLSILHSFSKLETLDLSCTKIATLDRLPKSLKELNLSHCIDLTAQELRKLDDSFSQLEKLNVSLTWIATLDRLPKSLKELNLSDCAGVIAEDFQKLDDSFSKLEKLNVSGTKIVTPDGLHKSLKELNLTLCIDLAAEDFQKLDDSFSKLEKLEVEYTPITTLDRLPKSLKELNLTHCEDLAVEEFQKLNDSFSKLEKLDVSATKIAKLDMLPKSLKELDLSQCENLTAQELQMLTSSFDKLQLIYLPEEFEDEEVVSTLKNLNKKVLFL